MAKIGILAYGSLIEDPGDELRKYIVEKISNVKTPFRIEFARKSKTRGNGPTLIPFENGKIQFSANLLILKEVTEIQEAKNLLYRRETGKEGTDAKYEPSENPGVNDVIIMESTEYPKYCNRALYTKIGCNIDNLDPENLAKLAIESVKSSAGEQGKDAIKYLISMKKHKIVTPLMPYYEEEILKQTGAKSLKEARDKIIKEAEHN